ncbi:MAG: hypothetical protein U0Q15_11500 [Kineosporiaceae bacterium]
MSTNRRIRAAVVLLALAATTLATATPAAHATPAPTLRLGQKITFTDHADVELLLPAGTLPFAAVDFGTSPGNRAVSFWLYPGPEGEVPAYNADTSPTGGSFQVVGFDTPPGMPGPIGEAVTAHVGIYASEVLGPVTVSFGAVTFKDATLAAGRTATVALPRQGSVADVHLPGFSLHEPVRLSVVRSRFVTPQKAPVAKEVLRLGNGAFGPPATIYPPDPRLDFDASAGSSLLVPALMPELWTPHAGSDPHLTLTGTTGDRGTLVLRAERVPVTVTPVTWGKPFRLAGRADGVVDYVLTVPKAGAATVDVAPGGAGTPDPALFAFQQGADRETALPLDAGQLQLWLDKGTFTIRVLPTADGAPTDAVPTLTLTKSR